MLFTSAISPFGVHGAFPLWALHNPACCAAQTSLFFVLNKIINIRRNIYDNE
jgi:hypothetical protein